MTSASKLTHYNHDAILRDVYVVHGITRNRNVERREQRETFGNNFHAAFKAWKDICKLDYRAALFYWNGRGQCGTVYASDDYLLDRDYPNSSLTRSNAKA